LNVWKFKSYKFQIKKSYAPIFFFVKVFFQKKLNGFLLGPMYEAQQPIKHNTHMATYNTRKLLFMHFILFNVILDEYVHCP
jgi:Na+-transporting NADH:ubiquinone oxidoreductase subunit NqrB